MHPLLEARRDEVKALARQHGVTPIQLSGYMARGDADANSDVDLLVALPPGVSGLALSGLLMDVQALTGRRVEVTTDDGLHPLIRERVQEEAQPL